MWVHGFSTLLAALSPLFVTQISWALWVSENVQLSILLGWQMVGRHPTIFYVNAELGFSEAIKTEVKV
jgi:hypothetical protein